MDEKELLRQILDALQGKGGSGSAPRPDDKDIKNFDDWAKNLRKHTEELTKSQPKLKTFGEVIKLNGVQAKDFSYELQDLEKQIQKNVEAGNSEVVQHLNLKKVMLEEATVREQSSAAILNFGVGLTRILTTTIATAAIDFVKGLQAGQSGVELYSNAAKAGAQATTDGLTMVGDVAGTAGNALSKMPGWIGIIGTAFAILGPIVGMVAKAMGKIGQEGLTLLQKEVEKTQKAFVAASSSGALFADGMTGMRNAAHKAGLTTDQFAEVLKNQSSNIAASGLGMTEGIKQLGQVKQIMKKSGVETSLMNLGFGFKEQAELVAETQANMARAGGGKATAEQVATQTEKYAENLRLISNLTGEDAKAKMKQVREQNQILAFQNKVAEMGPEQQAQLEAAMANMTETDKKALRDRIINNGVVIDKEAALAEATNAGAKAQNEAIYNLVTSGKATAESVASVQAEYADSIKAGARANQSAAVAAMYSGSEGAKAIAKSNLDYLNQTTKVNKDTVAQAQADLKGAKETTDPLTQTVNAIETNAQNMKVALEQELTPAIGKFAKELLNAGESIAEMLERLGLKKSAATTKIESERKAWAAEAPGTRTDSGMDFSQFAVGGVVTRPTRAIIGEAGIPEAVIPMPDNRTVPVTITGGGAGSDMSGVMTMLQTYLEEQSSQQQEMLRVMQDNRDYTQQLMYNLT